MSNPSIRKIVKPHEEKQMSKELRIFSNGKLISWIQERCSCGRFLGKWEPRCKKCAHERTLIVNAKAKKKYDHSFKGRTTKAVWRKKWRHERGISKRYKQCH